MSKLRSCFAISLFLLCSLLSAKVSASDVSKVLVIKKSWYVTSRNISPGYYPGMAGCVSDRLHGSTERNDEACENNPAYMSLLPFQSPRYDLLSQFVYELKVQNSTDKTIDTIRWEYDFLDPVTQQLRQRHSFTTKTKIRPGKTARLIETSSRPPTSVISASSTAADLYLENARVVGVEFAR